MDIQELDKLHRLILQFKKEELKCGRECPYCKYQSQDLTCTIIALMDMVAERKEMRA